MGLEEDFGPSQGFVTILVSCRQRGHGPLCLPLSTEVAAAGSSCQFLSWPGTPCPVSCPSSAPHVPPVPLTAWGQRAAVGAQSVTAPLNRVLSLCLSLFFSSSLCLLLPPVPGNPLPILTGNAPVGSGVCHLLLPHRVPVPRGSADPPLGCWLSQGVGTWGECGVL